MDLSLLDRADPGAWYLDSPEYAELADVQLVVEGVALPAHGAVLARASRVLRDLLRDQRIGGLRLKGAAAPAEVGGGLLGARRHRLALARPTSLRAATPSPPCCKC